MPSSTTPTHAVAGVALPPAPVDRPPLRRVRDCAVSGVAAGLARHLGWPLWVVRTAFVALTVVWGAGALLYAWLWVFVPWDDPRPPGGAAGTAGGGDPTSAGKTDAATAAAHGHDVPTRRVPVAWLLTGAAIAVVLVTMAAIALFGANGVGRTSPPGWVGGVLLATALAVAAGAWATLVDRRDPARGPRHENVVRIVVTAALILLLLTQLSALRQTGIAGFVIALVPIAGILLVYSSILVDRWRELSGERVRRIREEQRAEMAAHLHDSVLQTLALIQNRAGASSEVARLARAQERELRAWLYDGDAPADSDLPTDLRDYAAALELDYPVRIDVVSAGLPAERASGEVAAASREAMLNAARHAGGDVSVYIEGNANAVDVYVRDRGPGFDLDDVRDDRLGIRQSILGRMRRAGGSATVRRGAGGGTEVHLRYAATPSPDAGSAHTREASRG
ncbi:ATP-binding protein [Microbacterium trichothecenolyticum]|uniref:Nitrate/nitrite sensor protein NarX n=1 Tax=Microbacterium trichothecenolyticum TaxID=69370 RepID=A0A0M2H3L2_MICTR|nr:ATP-binding protein [Microbacterium trichothecenolyticum]KJL41022.1 nitrate/nitrite sensor protein NarX [Microbacterium trichothecenolyticum]